MTKPITPEEAQRPNSQDLEEIDRAISRINSKLSDYIGPVSIYPSDFPTKSRLAGIIIKAFEEVKWKVSLIQQQNDSYFTFSL